MATTINTGTAQVTVLNAAERTTGRRGYWEVKGTGGRVVVVNRKRDALRFAAGVARAERNAARKQRDSHRVFVTLPREQQVELTRRMNVGRQSDRDAARRLYADLALLAA